jgi:polyphosphate kinase 2 PPK2
VQERRYWDDYQTAFSEMLSATSTEHAPWYVIPADRKWFAGICVSAVLAHTLIELDPRYPRLDDASRRQLLTYRASLDAEAPGGDGTGADTARGRGHRAAVPAG